MIIHDAHAMTDMAEDVGTTLTPEQKEATRRLICGNAKGRSRAAQVADAELLMHMLGVHPDDRDDECGLAPYRPQPMFNRPKGS